MLRGQYTATASAAGARVSAALRATAAHGREAQVALLAAVSTLSYVVTQPPTALWRALSGLDFLAGTAILAASLLAALAVLAPGRPATKVTTMRIIDGDRAHSAERAVRRAALLDAASCIAAPWVAMALGFAASSAPFCAPQLWYAALSLLARAMADAASPAGAARTAGAFAAAFDALRLLALWRLASPARGVAAALQLAAAAAACHAAFVARLGAELPAMAAARAAAREAPPKQRKAADKAGGPATAHPSAAKGPEAAMPQDTPPAATDAVSPRRVAADAASEVRSPREEIEKEWAMPSCPSPREDADTAEQALRVAKEMLRAVTADESAQAAKKRS